MHIVFVQPLLPSYSIAFFNRLCEKDNVRVTVLADIFCNKQLNQYVKQDCLFDVIHLKEQTLAGFVLRPNLVKLLARLNYDHLILNGNPRDLSQLYVLIRDRVKGNPAFTLGMFHRIGGSRFVSECYYKLAGKLSVSCLTYTKKGVVAQLGRGIKSDKLIALGTAIDEKKVIAVKKERSSEDIELFKQRNKLCGKKIILQVVRLSAIKKPELLIDAALEVVKIDKNVLFVLIGGGDLEFQLKEKVSSLGISENVLFLGPIYDEKLLSFWFLSANIFVVPSCIGLSAHHAMCYELPIITDNDYAQQASEFEIISDGLNACLYQANNSSSLADKINFLLADEETCKFIASNAFYTVTKLSNLDTKVSNLLQALKSPNLK